MYNRSLCFGKPTSNTEICTSTQLKGTFFKNTLWDYRFKGIVSRDFVVCFLVSIDNSWSLLYKVVSPDFDKTAVARSQIFTMHFPGISISHNTVSAYNWTTVFMTQNADISFSDTGHGAPLRRAFRFGSEKLLNPVNQVDPLYLLKLIFQKNISFTGGFKKN
jgi:hypothetical protein